MLFAEADCRIRLACDNRSLTAKLMHPEVYRSCHCLAERMSRCICITAGPRANPQRPIGVAEQPKGPGLVLPYIESRGLRWQGKECPRPSFFPHCYAWLLP